MASTIDQSKTPALPPPNGITSNLQNPHNSLRPIWIMSLTICLFFPSVLVPLRLYIKAFVMESLQLVDCKFPAIFHSLPLSDKAKSITSVLCLSLRLLTRS